MSALFHADSMFAVAPEHNKTGANYAIDIFEDNVVFTFKKSLLPEAQARQFGMVGSLLNKFIGSKLPTEEFTFSLKDVKKMELATSSMMGKTNKNLMFWNTDPAKANYENIYFTLNLNEHEAAVKKALAKLMESVPYEEKTL